MKISQHASVRLQQRGIPMSAIDCIMLFGTPEKAKGGAVRYRFTNKSYSEAEGHLKGMLQRLASMRGTDALSWTRRTTRSSRLISFG